MALAPAIGVKTTSLKPQVAHLIRQVHELTEENRELIRQARLLQRESREVMRAAEECRLAVRRGAAPPDSRNR